MRRLKVIALLIGVIFGYWLTDQWFLAMEPKTSLSNAPLLSGTPTPNTSGKSTVNKTAIQVPSMLPSTNTPVEKLAEYKFFRSPDFESWLFEADNFSKLKSRLFRSVSQIPESDVEHLGDRHTEQVVRMGMLRGLGEIAARNSKNKAVVAKFIKDFLLHAPTNIPEQKLSLKILRDLGEGFSPKERMEMHAKIDGRALASLELNDRQWLEGILQNARP